MSIVETLVGIIILALVLIPGLNVLISGTKSIRATRDHVLAAYFAHRALETVRSYPFDSLVRQQWPDGSIEAEMTLQSDMEGKKGGTTGFSLTEKLKAYEQINWVIYEVVNPKIELCSTDGPARKPSEALFAKISFQVRFTTPDGRIQTLDVATARARGER